MINIAICKKCDLCILMSIYKKSPITLIFITLISTIILISCTGCSNYFPSDNPDNGTSKNQEKNSTLLPITQKETEYNYGYVTSNKKYKVTFQLHNPTDMTLSVRRVRSECKCMYAIDPPKTIPAKGTSSFDLVFESPKKPQYYDKKLIIQTSSPDYPLFSLRIKASVGRPLLCQPEILRVGSIAKNEQREMYVTIRNQGKKPVRPVYATSSVDGILAQIPRAEIPPNGKLDIPLTIQPDGTMPKDGTAVVHIHTDLSSQPQIDVKVQYSLANISK